MSTTIMKDPKLKVVKRDGKKDTFQGEKIAVAIKKGFDGLVTENSYTVEDANKVYEAVIEEINKDYDKLDLIKIEDIQDLIEKLWNLLRHIEKEEMSQERYLKQDIIN